MQILQADKLKNFFVFGFRKEMNGNMKLNKCLGENSMEGVEIEFLIFLDGFEKRISFQ